MSTDWIVVTVRRVDCGPVIIIEPSRLAGTEVLGRADREMCGARPPDDVYDQRIVCGLVAGHECEHWRCSAELVKEAGPFALRRVRVAAGEDA